MCVCCGGSGGGTDRWRAKTTAVKHKRELCRSRSSSPPRAGGGGGAPWRKGKNTCVYRGFKQRGRWRPRTIHLAANRRKAGHTNPPILHPSSLRSTGACLIRISRHRPSLPRLPRTQNGHLSNWNYFRYLLNYIINFLFFFFFFFLRQLSCHLWLMGHLKMASTKTCQQRQENESL